MMGSGQIGILFFFFLNIKPLRLADGVIGKTYNFINQSGILLSIKGALLIIMPGQVQAGTILGKLAYMV